MDSKHTPMAQVAENFVFFLRKQEDGTRWPVGTKLYAESPLIADALRFRLRMARLLAEFHGEDLLSEQQCARYMGIDLVSWRRLERTFSAGACFVEGEPGELPEDAETILLTALGAAP